MVRFKFFYSMAQVQFKWFGLKGLRVPKQFGSVFVLREWFNSIQFGFKAKKPKQTRPIASNNKT